MQKFHKDMLNFHTAYTLVKKKKVYTPKSLHFMLSSVTRFEFCVSKDRLFVL